MTDRVVTFRNGTLPTGGVSPGDLAAEAAARGAGDAGLQAQINDKASASALSAESSARTNADAALLDLASAGDQVRLSYVSGDSDDAVYEVVAAQAALTLGAGQLIQFAWPGGNTGAGPTLTIGAAEYTLLAADGGDLAAADLRAGSYVGRIHSGTVIRVLNLTRVADVPGLGAKIGALDAFDLANQQDVAEALNDALDAQSAAAVADAKAVTALTAASVADSKAVAAQATADDAVQDAAEALNEAMDVGVAVAAEVTRATGVEAGQQAQIDAAALERQIMRAVQQVLASAGITPMGPNNLGLLYGVKIGNSVLFGQRPSGTTYMGTVLLEVTGENNLGVVWGIAAQSSDGKLRLLIGITSDGVIVGADVESRSRIELLITTGQSLAEGAGTAITTTAPYTGGEALKFANGPVGKQSEVTGPGLVALAEQTNESIATGCARRILAEHPDRTLLMAGQAWGGKTLAEISLGAPDGVYEKIQDQMDLAAAQSRGAVARVVNMIEGEADGLISNTTYDRDLEAYRQQFAIDCAERLGQTEIPYLFTCQTSSVAGYKGGSIALRDSFTTPFLQLRAALTNPLIVLVGPKYQYTYLDHSHIDSLSTRLHGEKYGQVYRHVITDQRQWLPVHASNVVRDNDSIVLTLHSPVSMPVEIDDVAVTDPGDYGFNLLDAGGVTIGSVTQTGDYEVTVECSGNVPDGSRLSYAFHNGTSGTSGWDTGARGCIRDSDPTRSIYTNAAMPNWLCAFQTNF